MIVPMKTKKSPRATESATTVTVLGDAMGSPRQVPTNTAALLTLSKAQALSTERAGGTLRRQQAARMTKGEQGSSREKLRDRDSTSLTTTIAGS